MDTFDRFMIVVLFVTLFVCMAAFNNDKSKEIITAVQSNGCNNSTIEPIITEWHERRETYFK